MMSKFGNKRTGSTAIETLVKVELQLCVQVQVLFYCNHSKSQFKQHTRSKSHGMETMGGP